MKTYSKLFLLALLILSFIDSNAQKSKLKADHLFFIDRGHSYVGFSITYMGYAKVRGRFSDFNGIVVFDQDNPEKTTASIVIKTESITTENDWRDKDLKSDQWFDVEKYPEITFQTTSVKKTDGGIDVSGDLTIRDVTKNITIKMAPPIGVVPDTRSDSQVIFTGGVVINRKDFGVEGKRWAGIKEGITSVADEVEIELTILGKQYQISNLKNFVRNPESSQGKIYQTINENGVKKGLEQFAELKEMPDSRVSGNTLNIVGYVLFKEDRVEEALEVLNHNLVAFPDFVEGYNTLGEVLLSKNDYKKAKESFSKALEMDPGNLSAREALRHF